MKLLTLLKVAIGLYISETKDYFTAIKVYAEVAESHPDISCYNIEELSVAQWHDLEDAMDAKEFASRKVTTALTKEVDYSDMYAPKKIIN